MKTKYILSALFVLFTVFFSQGKLDLQSKKLFVRQAISPSAPAPPKELTPGETIATTRAKVVRVIDGDTIEIEGKVKVRYVGIDTPELHHPKKQIECFGTEAYAKNKELVEGKEVLLEKDVSNTDRYGRLLRYVYLPADNQETKKEAMFVNDFLVRQGYAYIATFPPDVKYQQVFLGAQQEARTKNRGLWKSCPSDKSSQSPHTLVLNL